MAVEPEKFYFVVASARGLDAGKVEFFDEFGFRIDFLFGAVIPTETGEVVQHGLGEDAVVAIFGDGFSAVAFAEFFLAVGAEDMGERDDSRHLDAKGFIESEIVRGAGEIFDAAHDEGAVHEIIIDDVGEIIGRETVFFDEDDVVLDLGAGIEVTHDFVVPSAGFWIGFEANRDAFLPLWGVLRAMIAVKIGDFFGVILVAILLDGR